MRRVLGGMMLFAAGAAAGISVDRGTAGAADMPAPGIQRTILQRVDVPGSNYEVVLATAAVPAGVASIGRHKHNGFEMGVAIEGESTMTIDGEDPRPLATGESYLVPLGAPHDVSTGEAPGKVVAVFVVEKGKPLATPVP